ncbi:MAG: hypothetical protein RH982_14045 [Parvibaculum sp.]|uniref:hypothetical protein n=1 Tax=Parvibaculum sp. TaxID=2024848 RepID=UPI0032ECAA5D
MSQPAFAPEPDDYDAIEQAVRETPRGRWFLEEFARRHTAGAAEVVGAIEKLARETDAGLRLGFVYHEAQELARTLAEAQAGFAEVNPGEAAADPAAVADAAARAATDIASAAGRLQEIAEALRGKNADADLCDEIETHAAGIFMAAAYEELTGKRIAVVTQALDRIEERIARLIERWEMEVR